MWTGLIIFEKKIILFIYLFVYFNTFILDSKSGCVVVERGSFFRAGQPCARPHARKSEYILIRCDLLVVYSAFEPLSWHNGR